MSEITTKEIYDELITAKETKSSLDGLLPNPETSDQFVDDVTSGSKVAFWRHIFWIFSELGRDLRNAFTKHKSEVDAAIDNRLAPSVPWFREQILKWQYGDSLVPYGTQYKYPTITPANQIVKQCSVLEGDGRVTIKVAKGDPLEKLSTDERNSLMQYIRQKRPPGTSVFLISEDADLLQLDLGVYVNSSLINLNGELISDPSVKPIEEAINDYIEAFSATEFDGTFRTTKLVDAIQAVEGVIDVDVRVCQYKYGDNDYADVPVYYRSYSGYINIDPLFPLTDVIEYLDAT